MDKFLELMKKLNIAQVYWVDDENASTTELDLSKLSATFVTGLVEATPEESKFAMAPIRANGAVRAIVDKIQGVLEKLDEDEDSKFDRVLPYVETIIEKIDNSASVISDAIRKLPVPLGGAEKQALVSLFTNHADLKWRWEALSFSKWEAEKQKLLIADRDSAPALFIVDLQNNSESTAADGDTVLSDLASANLDRKSCHLIVLTSECKKNQEFRTGRSLTDKYCVLGGRRIPVFALSKHRFAPASGAAQAEMASAFVNALERAELSLVQLEFSNIMRSHFVKSIDVALNALESVTIEELMFAVTHTSKSEGVSEVETLLRLMSIAQREEFQSVIANSAELREAVIKLRNARIPIDRSDLGTDGQIIRLRCAELYDKPEVINTLYSPVAPGDLFAIRQEIKIRDDCGSVTGTTLGDEHLYVVVANACDLMLRETGKRKLDHCVMLYLGKVGEVEKEQFGFSLPHLEFTNVLNASKRQIELRQYLSASMALLDLCWTNEAGICTWSKVHDAKLSESLLDSQRARLATLDKIYRACDATDLDKFAQPLGAALTVVLKEDRQLDKVSFEVRRVGRLSHTHAAQLIARFATVFARPSEEHDFSAAH